MKKKSDGTTAKLWEVLSALDGLPYSEFKRMLATYLYEKDHKRVKFTVSTPMMLNYIVTAIVNGSHILIYPWMREKYAFLIGTAACTNMYLFCMEMVNMVHIRNRRKSLGLLTYAKLL